MLGQIFLAIADYERGSPNPSGCIKGATSFGAGPVPGLSSKEQRGFRGWAAPLSVVQFVSLSLPYWRTDAL